MVKELVNLDTYLSPLSDADNAWLANAMSPYSLLIHVILQQRQFEDLSSVLRAIFQLPPPAAQLRRSGKA